MTVGTFELSVKKITKDEVEKKLIKLKNGTEADSLSKTSNYLRFSMYGRDL